MLLTHSRDLGVRALCVLWILQALLTAHTQLFVDTGLPLDAPHTPVLGVCVLTQAAVLPAQRAVVQVH